jgi:Domain of unknown function (DUF222)/HNH endonuclease
MDVQLANPEGFERQRQLQALANEITELAGHLNAANYRFLKLIAEFDAREGWADGATCSCAHWLNWKCGIDIGAAREKVRTARALEKLPRIAAAMERGELSYSKARALTRVACAQTEEALLNIALHGTANHVETTVRHFRRCLESQERSREELQHYNRSVDYHWDDDGSLILRARLPAPLGAKVLKALEAASEELHGKFEPQKPGDHPVDARERKPTMRRADALALISESFLQHGAEAMTSGDRHQIVIHVDAETFRGDAAGRCQIDEGPSVSAETSRRLACDAGVVTLLEDERGEPLNIGRKTRTIPTGLRRALNARDRGCRFPGCPHKRFVEGHHIEHWAKGGETKLSNLVSLCDFHHRKVHEGAVRVEVLDDGALRFTYPNGRSIDSTAPLHGDWKQLPILNEQHGIHINAKTAATRWGGEKMDYDLGIWALLHLKDRGERVSAETPAN